jgi:ABC-type lipoprotein export system ATPase subunit
VSAVVALSGVARSFEEGGRRRDVLAGIDLEVNAGEMVALVGPSGCGKTTLLSIVGALDAGFAGRAELLGRDLAKLDDDTRSGLRAAQLGFVFQAFCLLDHLTVRQNVEVPLWLLDDGPDAEASARRASEMLERVGLGGREAESVMQLSGGERQRVAIARAMINRPKLLLADEPTGNLDPKTGARIFELFDAIRGEEGCAVLVATHDAALAERADRVVRLDGGRVEGSPP